MSLGYERNRRGAVGFPRVSGDEPAARALNEEVERFSPRERG